MPCTPKRAESALFASTSTLASASSTRAAVGRILSGSASAFRRARSHGSEVASTSGPRTTRHRGVDRVEGRLSATHDRPGLDRSVASARRCPRTADRARTLTCGRSRRASAALRPPCSARSAGVAAIWRPSGALAAVATRRAGSTAARRQRSRASELGQSRQRLAVEDLASARLASVGDASSDRGAGDRVLDSEAQQLADVRPAAQLTSRPRGCRDRQRRSRGLAPSRSRRGRLRAPRR